MKYFEAISDKKAALDEILTRCKAEPVGWGYIDTIVHRNNVDTIVAEISEIGFLIFAVSWWEHLEDNNKKARIGMGGPISIYYPGWFSETPEYDEIGQDVRTAILGEYDFDSIKSSNDRVLQNILMKETKKYGEDYLIYQRDAVLTPGLWIEVPDEWINPLTNPNKVGFLPEYERLRKENEKKNFA